MEPEKLEVRCGPHLFRWGVTLTPSQKEKKRKGLGYEEEGRKARERKEELEVSYGPHFFRRNIILTLSQREKRRDELEREKKEKEVRERKERFKVSVNPTSSDSAPFRFHRRRRGEGGSNVRKK